MEETSRWPEKAKRHEETTLEISWEKPPENSPEIELWRRPPTLQAKESQRLRSEPFSKTKSFVNYENTTMERKESLVLYFSKI